MRLDDYPPIVTIEGIPPLPGESARAYTRRAEIELLRAVEDCEREIERRWWLLAALAAALLLVLVI
jgi:hypothetical protein